MRGPDVMQEGLFSFNRLEEFVPPDHPLRGIRAFLNAALARLDAQFDDMYSPFGRDSIAPDCDAGIGFARACRDRQI